MTKQILVDATLPMGNLNSTTYVVVQDDEKGMIKTIKVGANHFTKQAEEILEIAYKYKINKIKIDVHGIGLGLYERLVDIVGEENTNRKTGEVNISTKTIDNTYLKIEKHINDAIKETEMIQKQVKTGSLDYSRALKTQLELERLKLNLLENHANLLEQTVIECGEFE